MPTVGYAPHHPAEAFANQSTVALTRDVSVSGRDLPAGTHGVVIVVDDTDADVQVRFKKPFDATVTLSGVDLTV